MVEAENARSLPVAALSFQQLTGGSCLPADIYHGLLAEFWECYDALPQDLQEQADKQYALFEANPSHPSLRFKETGPYWSVRVSRGYRALARRRGNDLYWFWIGSYDGYERLIKG